MCDDCTDSVTNELFELEDAVLDFLKWLVRYNEEMEYHQDPKEFESRVTELRRMAEPWVDVNTV